MLEYKLTPHHAGMVLWGDFATLHRLHEFIHHLVEESRYIEDKEGFVLGLAYDVRKAFQGSRHRDYRDYPDDDRCRVYGVEILWPLILVQVSVLRQYSQNDCLTPTNVDGVTHPRIDDGGQPTQYCVDTHVSTTGLTRGAIVPRLRGQYNQQFQVGYEQEIIEDLLVGIRWLHTDLGRADNGLVFVVTEFLAGDSLATQLAREGPLPWTRLGPIALQICAALATVHRAGIVHRDIKPSNCFRVRVAGNPDVIKVLDFGIAKVLEGPAAPDRCAGPPKAPRASCECQNKIAPSGARQSRQAAPLNIPRQLRSRVLPFRANHLELFSGRLRKVFCDGASALAYRQGAASCKQQAELHRTHFLVRTRAAHRGRQRQCRRRRSR